MTSLEDLDRRVAALEARELAQGFAAVVFAVSAGLAALREEMAGRFDVVDRHLDEVEVTLALVAINGKLDQTLRRLPEPGS